VGWRRIFGGATLARGVWLQGIRQFAPASGGRSVCGAS